jgi:Carbohydrate binding module (family 35)
MAGADDGGLRVGPYVPEAGVEPTDGSTENAVTEIIPAVGDGPSDPEEAPKVRAVARRSAVALPALGRADSATKVPRSSRSTLDRRERQRERERAAAAATDTAPASIPAAPGGERPPRPRPVNPFAGRPPQPRRSPEQTRPDGDDGWPADEPWPEVPPAPPPPPVPSRLLKADDTAELEMALEPAASGLTSEATKERSEEGRGGLGAPGPARAERAPIGTERAPIGTERAPVGADGDTWDEEPSGTLGNDAYQGRRRARHRAVRPLVVAGIVVLLVGALVVVPLILRSGPTGGTPTAADPGTQPAVVVPLPSPTPTGDESGISSTAGPGASTTPSRTAVRTSTRPAPVLPVNPTIEATTEPSTTVPPFQTLTIEAESGNVVQPAERSSYAGTSGGQIVGFLGVTEGRSGRGRLILGVSVPTAGTYTVTFHYIGNNNRTAHIIVNGNQAGTVPVPARTNCCGTGSLNVTLQAGTNTIEFTNPTARCPAIDRVVITRP